MTHIALMVWHGVCAFVFFSLLFGCALAAIVIIKEGMNP